jgi:kinesin family protein 11
MDGRTSRAESVASSRAPRSSPLKRKEREFEHDHEETNINVVVRCRGRNDREVRENSGVVVTTNGIKGSTVELSMGSNALSNKTYQFDKVFSPAADQNMVFDEVVSPILDEACPLCLRLMWLELTDSRFSMASTAQSSHTARPVLAKPTQ